MSSDDSWDFKIEKPKTEAKDGPAKPKNSRAAVTKEKRKRRQKESDLSGKGPQVGIETPSVGKRKSRSDLAREYERDEDKKIEPHPHEIYGSLIRRSMATGLDLCFAFLVCVLTLNYQADFWIQLELQVFGLNDYGQGPLITYFGSLAVSVYLLACVAPTVVLGRSLGKALAGVKVYGRELVPLGFLKTLFREVVLKPLSALSILGVLICYLSKERKMLHDHLIGSTVRRY